MTRAITTALSLIRPTRSHALNAGFAEHGLGRTGLHSHFKLDSIVSPERSLPEVATFHHALRSDD